MTQVTIREYLPQDREVFERCTAELQEDERARQPHIWKEPGEMKSAYVDHAIKSAAGAEGKIFVAEIEGKMAGYVIVITNEDESPAFLLKKYGYIMDLVVLREYRGQGVGKALMEHAEEYIRAMDLEWMQLDVTVGNPAREFYAHSGYREKDVRMEKKLK